MDGRPKQFCSASCKSRFHYLAKRKPKSSSRSCAVCSVEFQGPSYKKYCSIACRVQASNAVKRTTPIGSPPKNKIFLRQTPLLKELSPVQPIALEEILLLSSSSAQKLNWICSVDSSHVWSASVRSRKVGSGCLICKGNIVQAGFNDLETRSPEVIQFWDYDKNALMPNQVAPNSRKVVHWKCPEGHTWSARPSRLVAGRGCGFCAGQRVDSSNSLLSLNPDFLSEWDYAKNQISPDSLVPKSGKRVFWLCEHGHSYQARPIDRYIYHRGCPTCAGRVLLPGFNDLASCYPDIAREWSTKNKIRPNEIGKGSDRKFWWTCSKCQSDWFANVVNRTGQSSGCPHCSFGGGYDHTIDGYLYLLRKSDEGLQQFGITNNPKRRLAQHAASGWEALDVIGPADGLWIREIETALKRFFKQKGLLLKRNTPDKFEGYTESWQSSGLEFVKIDSLLKAMREHEEGLQKP